MQGLAKVLGRLRVQQAAGGRGGRRAHRARAAGDAVRPAPRGGGREQVGCHLSLV